MNTMDIMWCALDVYKFLKDNKIEGKVTFVCHSFGFRIASVFAQVFPDKVHAMCSIDSPPVDIFAMRDPPKIFTEEHVNKTAKNLETVKGMNYKEAFKFLKEELK